MTFRDALFSIKSSIFSDASKITAMARISPIAKK
jgi:hypothetical protein